MKKILLLIMSCVLTVADVSAEETKEHFLAGQIRAGLNWDNISAMESGELRFGGTAGVYVLNGLEVGYEHLFVVPPEAGSQSRSYGYLRAVPFRDWPVNPFVSVRAGYFFLPDRDAVSLGASGGLVMFIDKHFAFEARMTGQVVYHPVSLVDSLVDFDWRFVVYF